MSRRVLVLVEGQTEERFVKDVLGPAFWAREIYFSPTILTTKRVKDGPDFKGGVTNFDRFRNDLERLLRSAGDAWITTLLDYYGLPADFPGMADRPGGSPETRVRHVEQALFDHFGRPRHFIPFLALHELEAWLFSSVEVLPEVLTRTERQPELAAIRNTVANPEQIDEGIETAPSKRILRLFPSYRKTLHGPIALGRIGLDAIRNECPHFRSWIERLGELPST